DSGLQASEGPKWDADSAVGGVLGGDVDGCGNEDIRDLKPWHLEVFGEHADDANGVVVDGDGLVEDAGVSVISVEPEGVGDERDSGAGGYVFFGQEVSAEDGIDTEGVQEVRGYRGAVETYGA